MAITILIPYGRENAITRSDLSRKANMTDRATRDAVHDCRSTWTPIEPFICSDSGGKGYWLTNDISEIEEFRRWYKSYGDSGGFLIGNLDRQLAKMNGSGMVYVRAHYRRVSGGT